MNRTLIIFLAGALALAGIFLVSQGFSKTVTLEINGHPQVVETKAWRVSSFLNEQGITLHEQDSIDPSPSAWIIGEDTITIEHADWITISADEKLSQFFTRQRSLETLLSEASIELNDGDLILLDGVPVSIRMCPRI